jgi:hypothetical protein
MTLLAPSPGRGLLPYPSAVRDRRGLPVSVGPAAEVPACSGDPVGVDTGAVGGQEHQPVDPCGCGYGVQGPEGDFAIGAGPAGALVVVEDLAADRDAGLTWGGYGWHLRPSGGGWCLVAAGLLHVLAADPLTAGGAGSRAGEAQKSRRWVQGPAARLGLLRRALDADPAAVTLRARREGVRPPHGDAA